MGTDTWTQGGNVFYANTSDLYITGTTSVSSGGNWWINQPAPVSPTLELGSVTVTEEDLKVLKELAAKYNMQKMTPKEPRDPDCSLAQAVDEAVMMLRG